MTVQLHKGDCIEIMRSIPDKSIDFVLVDPPYGVTGCKWDTPIPLPAMWEEISRIVKEHSAVCVFGIEPFSSSLRMSNIQHYKYDWIWDKVNKYTGFCNCKRAPLKRYEIISVFGYGSVKYNPQMGEGKAYKKSGDYSSKIYGTGKVKKQGENAGIRYPYNILQFKGDDKRCGFLHPTQKPVSLLEYLIKTYTDENDTVLDFTMGSGSTGVAAVNTCRHFIGIEKDDTYFDIAAGRIEKGLTNGEHK